MSDTPKIHATLSDLDASAKAGPFVQALKNNKRITFPDPGEMEWTEATHILNMHSLTTIHILRRQPNTSPEPSLV